ncbi:MAG: DUF2070 family protein, partial [Thermoproteota archaeon]
MEKSSDDVSNIHNRFSLTLINPASHYFSLVGSLAIAAVIVSTVYFGYLGSDEIWFRILGVIGILALTQLIDIQFTRKKEYSKSLHASLFGNMLWIAVLLMGLLASVVLAKEASLFFVTYGMFLFASFRIGIFTTTLGASIRKAWAICMVQPLAMFLVMIPYDMWNSMLTNPMAIGFGAVFLIIASV